MAEEDVGIVLIVLGVVFMALGFLIPFACGLGLILLIIGIVLWATQRTRTQAMYPPSYGYPAQPGYAYGAPPTAPGAPVPQAPYTQPACSVCGTGLTWVPQYGRWYCTRCQAYR